MNWHQLISRPADLLVELERAAPDASGALAPWLRFLTTESIESWARRSRRVRKTIDYGEPDFKPVLRLLLRRHLLPVRARRDLGPLAKFWAWAVPHAPGLVDLWGRAGLPQTLEGAGVAQQEAAFAAMLGRCAEEVRGQGGPDWAARELTALAQARGETAGRPARRALARVVFAWQGARPADIRPGVLVEFELLARSGLQHGLNDRNVFGPNFLAGFDRDVRARVGTPDLRWLQHNLGFLGEPVLDGASGTIAVWLAQYLAAGGGRLGSRFALPAWVVVSAALDSAGPATGGSAAAVGGLAAKARLLVEEGVRVLVVAEETPASLPEVPDLEVVSLRGSVDDLACELNRRGLLVPVELEALEGELLQRPDTFASRQVSERFKAHFRHFDDEPNYLLPAYALRRIEAALASLPGRGYVQVMAEAGMGKSGIVYALKKRTRDLSLALRNVLGYSILHGRAEGPTTFLEHLKEQARRLNAEDEYDLLLLDLPGPRELRSWAEVQATLCRLLSAVREQRCPGQPLLLAIDGLDELTGEGVLPLMQSLPPAAALPEGCHIVLFSRPDPRPALTAALVRLAEGGGPFVTVVLNPQDEEYHGLLTDFLAESLGPAVAPHVAVLLEKARHRFLYARFLRDLLRGRDLALLKPGSLPGGEDLFPAYLDRMAGDVRGGPQAFADWHRPLLLLLAAAREPVTRGQLRRWLREGPWDADADHRLDRALEELEPLLHEERAELPDDSLFTIAHQEFLDWLRQTEAPPWSGSLRQAHEQIARAATAPPPRPRQDLDRAGRYDLVYAPAHLLAAGDCEGALRLLADEARGVWMYGLLQEARQRWEWTEANRLAYEWVVQLENATSHLAPSSLTETGRLLLGNNQTEAHTHRGLIRQAQSDHVGAIADLEKAVSLRVAALDGRGNPGNALPGQRQPWINLAGAYINLGLARAQAGDVAQAVPCFRGTLNLLRPLVLTSEGELREGAENLAVDNFATALEWLAHPLLRLLDSPEALERARQLLAPAALLREHLLRRAVGEGGHGLLSWVEGENVLSLANNYRNLALIHSAREEYVPAVEVCTRAIGLLNNLIAGMGGVDTAAKKHPELVRDLAGSYSNRSVDRLSLEEGHPEGGVEAAREDATQAIELLEGLVRRAGGEETAHPELLRPLGSAVMARAEVALKGGLPADALTDAGRAWALLVRAREGTESQPFGQLADADRAEGYVRGVCEQMLALLTMRSIEQAEQVRGMDAETQYDTVLVPAMQRIIDLHDLVGPTSLTPAVRDMARVLEESRRKSQAQGIDPRGPTEHRWEHLYSAKQRWRNKGDRNRLDNCGHS